MYTYFFENTNLNLTDLKLKLMSCCDNMLIGLQHVRYIIIDGNEKILLNIIVYLNA